MSFLHPEFLYFMLPPLFILFGLLLTQKSVQAQFFSQEVMDKLRVNANTLSLKARNVLFFFIGLLIVLALSGPVIKDGMVAIKAKSADIMIAFDISDSMLAEDVYPNRLKLAKQKAIDFISMAPNERVGVIAFAKNSYLVSPLSFDHGAVNFLLSQLDTTSITQKGTDILSLLEVVDASIQNNAKKYLLIISDGSDATDFTKEIAFAKEKNIVVFVLGMGTTKGAPIKLQDGNFIKYNGEIIVSKLNEAISSLAVESGGVYIENVKSQEDIKTMLSEIEKISEKKELKSEEIARFIPLFYYPLGLALFLLLIATSSMSKRVEIKLPFIFLLFILVVHEPNAQAGLLDFMQLQKAKEAYNAGDYEQSAKLYKQHAKATNNPQSYFNAANALYKEEKYDEALKNYESAHFETNKERADNYANIGNTNAKIQTQESLKKALEAYEKSLELQKDVQVQENYEALKKVFEEEKKEQQEENQEEKEKQKEKQNQEENKDKQEQSKDDESKDDQNKEGDEASQEQNSQKKDESKSQENQKPQESENQDEKKSQEENKKSDLMSNKEKNEDRQEKKPETQSQTKEDLKELEKEKNDLQNSPQKAEQTSKNMSDAEEEKWIQELNINQNSYMYMLNNENKNKEKTDEKPW